MGLLYLLKFIPIKYFYYFFTLCTWPITAVTIISIKIGLEQDIEKICTPNRGGLELAGTVVRYALGNKNEAVEQLLEFSQENCLFLANTYFEQTEWGLYTLTSPDDQYRNQIDYILGKRRWRSAFQSVKT
jgi:hypothetical protein